MPRDPDIYDRKYLEHDAAYVQSALETIAWETQELARREAETLAFAKQRLPGDWEIDGELETHNLNPWMKGVLDEAGQ